MNNPKTIDDQQNIINKQQTNIPLLLLDLIFLPIHAIRLFFIYLYGSKYNLKGFQFLDVIMHANNPYFNQEHDGRMIDTIGKDYRVVLRDDSRIYPIDLESYLENVIEIKKNSNNPNKFIDSVTIGSTDRKTNDDWRINTEHADIDESSDETDDESSYSDDNTDTESQNYKKNDVLNSIKAELNSVFE